VRRLGPLWVLGRSVLVLSLGACAGLTQQQSDRLKEAQDFANETTKLYGVPHVSVFNYEDLSPNAAAGYAGRHGWILLRRSTLEDTAFVPVLAHELGHATLGHDRDVVLGGQPPTMAAYRRALQQRELDANARAVEIMVRVMKKPEPEAVMMLASYLADANTARSGRAVGLPQNHMHPCDQLQDLALRFPGGWSREVTCEKAPGNLPLLPYSGTDRELGLE
jgi:Peptidase family M48